MRTDKPTTPENGLAKLQRVLEPLKQLPCAGWKFTPKPNGDGWGKPPYRADAPRYKASITRREHWHAFDTVLELVQASAFDGLSILLAEDGTFAAAELDTCLTSKGKVAPWAREIVKRAASARIYTEYSPSRRGLHFLGTTTGNAAKVFCNDRFEFDGERAGIEIFRGCRKPLTLTGLPFGKVPRKLVSIDGFINWLADYVAKRKAKAAKASPRVGARGNGADHDFVDVESLLRDGLDGAGDQTDSARFHRSVGSLKGRGWTIERITEGFLRYPEGVASKFITQNRLPRAVEQSFGKFELYAQAEAVEASEPQQPARPPRQRKAPTAPNLEPEEETVDEEVEAVLAQLYAHGDTNSQPHRSWLVKSLIPATGHGLLSGQTGVGKSFILIDLAATIGTGEPFLGHLTKRKSGTLIFAAEGADEMRLRVDAAARIRGDVKLPILWYHDAPPLLQPDALDKLIKMVESARQKLLEEFQLPLGLIGFDTLAATAGFDKAGDENDASVAGKAMTRLKALGQVFSCFSLAVDHFGKNVTSGTRGASSKEASADLVLAALADKALSGDITNARLAVRKNRGGPQGRQYPFTLPTQEMGRDEDDEPITTLTVKWLEPSASRDEKLGPPTDRWAEGCKQDKQRASALRLKHVMFDLLTDPAQRIEAPISEGGAVVRMVSQRSVQAVFYDRTANDEEGERTRQRKHAQYSRARDRAEGRQLIGISQIGGETHLWLYEPAEGEAP